MGYEPTLILRADQLRKHEDTLEHLSTESIDEEFAKSCTYLISVLSFDTHKFDDIELVLCTPSTTSFNKEIRDVLDEFEIDFRTDW